VEGGASGRGNLPRVRDVLRQAKAYYVKSKFFSPHAYPLNRIRVRWEFMRRSCYVQWPLYGHVLDAFRDGRLELDENVTLLAGCWLTLPDQARLRIGRGVYVNGNVMLHAYERIEIGDFTAISRGSIITDAGHRFDDPERPFLKQGMEVRTPTIIGKNVWVGANSAVMGVTLGDGCVVGANSVVTRDVPEYAIAVGAPARVVGSRLEWRDRSAG
jgi:acetyltransferase-like isoleucine patch superfamily enzyme